MRQADEVSGLTSDVEAAGRLQGRHRHAPQKPETRRQGHLGGLSGTEENTCYQDMSQRTVTGQSLGI